MSGWLAGLLDSIGIVPAAPGLLDAPVGTSTMQRLTNPSPTVSPLASAMLNSSDQKIGRFWNAATGRAKQHYTGADMAQLTAAGNEGLDAALGWAGMTTPIRAYHGSPHTFDRFDLSKIGTGEGAQAYGHGLYFAGNERVAKGYRDALATPRVNLDGAALSSPTGNFSDALADAWRQGKITPQQEEALSYVVGAPSLDDAITNLRAQARMPMRIGTSAAKEWNARADALEALRPRLEVQPTGSMYEVSLRTSPERLLDWDKPLAQQPAVVQELARSADLSHLKPGNRTRRMIEMWREGVEQPHNPATGHTFHNAVSDYGGQSNPALSEKLRAAGLDGIQYLDAGSRAAGDGSRNYVLFRDDIIDILKRYGLLGMLGGGAAAVGAEQ